MRNVQYCFNKMNFSALLIVLVFAVNLSLSAQSPKDVTWQSVSVVQLDEELTQSIEILELLVDSGKFADAESQARELLSKVETKYGVESIEAAKVIDQLIACMLEVENISKDEAKSFAERAVQIKENILGADHCTSSDNQDKWN